MQSPNVASDYFLLLRRNDSAIAPLPTANGINGLIGKPPVLGNVRREVLVVPDKTVVDVLRCRSRDVVLVVPATEVEVVPLVDAVGAFVVDVVLLTVVDEELVVGTVVVVVCANASI